MTFLAMYQVLEALMLKCEGAAWCPASRQLALAQHPLDQEFKVGSWLYFLPPVSEYQQFSLGS